MRKWMVTIWLLVIFGGIGALFWYNDWKFRLPTPIPRNYVAVSKGAVIALHYPLSQYKRPLFLHFFNPDCPCSRFNIATFRSLVQRYGNDVQFVIVVMSYRGFTERQIRKKFDINVPILFDSSIAAVCGVYSTPQAVLLDDKHRLYYRGNYNSSRYCTDERTSYAKQALEGLLQHRDMNFGSLALTAYGCQLPHCTR